MIGYLKEDGTLMTREDKLQWEAEFEKHWRDAGWGVVRLSETSEAHYDGFRWCRAQGWVNREHFWWQYTMTGGRWYVFDSVDKAQQFELRWA